MRIEIDLPESRTPRTHIAAKVASEYVAFELGKLPPSAWTDMMRDGFIRGQVAAEFVGVVKWAILAD
jgi:hypothetical protein